MTRKLLIAGNWKMNLTEKQANNLIQDIKKIPKNDKTQIAFFPSYIYLLQAKNLLQNTPYFFWGAQNMANVAEFGAYTGEISAQMLQRLNCQSVIIGHSERRQYYGETDAIIAQKTVIALKHNLIPIVCIGETLEEREAGVEQEVNKNQLTVILKYLKQNNMLDSSTNLIIAYEPVWAIGTGKTASKEQAEAMHKYIRSIVANYNIDLAHRIQILYGGSMNENNAKELLEQDNIDGGLIGGASLKIESFSIIYQIAQQLS